MFLGGRGYCNGRAMHSNKVITSWNTFSYLYDSGMRGGKKASVVGLHRPDCGTVFLPQCGSGLGAATSLDNRGTKAPPTLLLRQSQQRFASRTDPVCQRQ